MDPFGRDRFGELLKQFRLDAGMTQQNLAERAKLSIEAISTLERGARTRPHGETVAALVRALDLPPQREVELRSAADSSRRPQRETQSLLRLVRRDDVAASHTNLPQALTSFVGRESDLSEIAALLTQHQVVTVVGAAGVGKTRAAVELAREVIAEFPDGAWFVDLAPLAHEGLVDAALLSAVGLPAATALALEAAIPYLRTRQLLLILDNCEHVINRVRDVAAGLVQASPGVRVLATSLQALEIAGERIYRLPSLPVPPDTCRTAHGALSHAGVALFVDRAREAQPTFALNDDNAFDVAEIARRLDGIPLAIELAAARTNVLGPRQIIELLARRFRLLATTDPRVLPRHQTMTALLGWSYDLLSPREQRFFEALSVFQGGCTLEAVAAVCGTDGEDDVDVVNLIASLVAKSLLVAESAGSEHRYRLLESSKQYAREKLIVRGEHEQVAKRHALAYLHLAERLDHEYPTTPENEWLGRAQLESENWRAALDWALARRGDVMLGQRLAAIRTAPQLGFPRAEAQRWVQAALDAVDDRTPSIVVAQLEHAAAECARRLGNFKASLDAATRAVVRYRELDDVRGATGAQHVAGRALASMGRHADAEPMLRDALELSRSIGDRHLTASILVQTGTARASLRDFAGARSCLGDALALGKAIGAAIVVAAATAALADVEFLAGDAEAALQLIVDSLASCRTVHYLPGTAIALSDMALYLITLGRYDEARARSKEALELAQCLRLIDLVARSLQYLVAAAVLQPLDEGRPACADHATAARICGFAEAQISMLGNADESGPAYDRALAVLRTDLGGKELAKLMAAGATLLEEEAIAQTHHLET